MASEIEQLSLRVEELSSNIEQLRSELAPIIELVATMQRTMQAGPPPGGPMAMLAMLRGMQS